MDKIAHATNFINDYLETDKSDKTFEISNTEFLQAIFGITAATEHPLFVSFKGDPTNIAKHHWYGHPWMSNTTVTLPANANNYFSLARFK